MKRIIAISCMTLILWACSKDDAESPKFALEGLVSNVTERGVRGAEVRIYREGDNDPIETINTDDGNFDLNLEAGDYEIEVEADGYNVYSDDFSIDDDDDIEVTLLGDAYVSGHVTDSQTGYGLLNATVAFSTDAGAEDSEEADLIVETDEYGNFVIDGAPVGDFIQIIEAEGFFTRIVEDIEFEDGDNSLADQTVVEQPEEGSVRIILTWGENPHDLDSHLTGPMAGGRFHMSFLDGEPDGSNASLDVDDTFSFGPETTTITSFSAGTYRYSVHNYSDQTTSGASGIAGSPATVEIYDFDGLVESFKAPAAGTGNTWRVFEIVVSGTTASINPVNTYVTASSASDMTTFRTGKKQAIKFNAGDF